MQKASGFSPMSIGNGIDDHVEANRPTSVKDNQVDRLFHRGSRKGSSVIGRFVNWHPFRRTSENVPPALEPVVPVVKDKDDHLLLSLERRSQKVILGLCLANESVIDTHTLFELLVDRVAKRMLEKKSGFALVSLYAFVYEWLNANRHTELFAKALPSLQALCELADLGEYLKVKSICEKIKSLITHESRPLNTMPLPIPLQPVTRSFEKLLNELQMGAPADDAIRQVSWDLTLHQWQLICGISEHDFIKSKWGHVSGSGLRRFVDFQNTIDDFIHDKILQESTFEARICLVKFFLQVANDCLEHADFTSSFAIYQALNGNALLNRLSDTIYDDILNRLRSLFTLSGRSYPLLRAELAKWSDHFHIHYMPLVNFDIEMLDSGSTSTAVMGKLEVYNYEKLTAIQTFISKALFVQQLPFPKERHYHTDLVSKHLEKYCALTDEERAICKQRYCSH